MIQKEIAQFEKSMKIQLGPKTLAFTPYIAPKGKVLKVLYTTRPDKTNGK